MRKQKSHSEQWRHLGLSDLADFQKEPSSKRPLLTQEISDQSGQAFLSYRAETIKFTDGRTHARTDGHGVDIMPSGLSSERRGHKNHEFIQSDVWQKKFPESNNFNLSENRSYLSLVISINNQYFGMGNRE